MQKEGGGREPSQKRAREIRFGMFIVEISGYLLCVQQQKHEIYKEVEKKTMSMRFAV